MRYSTVLEAQLQTKLNGPWPMRIQRVQERSASDAIGSRAPEPGGIIRTTIATDDVIAAAPRVIRIVDTELSVVEHVESLGPEFELGPFSDLEVFQYRKIEV